MGKDRFLVKSMQGELQHIAGIYEMVLFFVSASSACWGVFFFNFSCDLSIFLKLSLLLVKEIHVGRRGSV